MGSCFWGVTGSGISALSSTLPQFKNFRFGGSEQNCANRRVYDSVFFTATFLRITSIIADLTRMTFVRSIASLRVEEMHLVLRLN